MSAFDGPFDLLDLWLGAAVDSLALTDAGAPTLQRITPGPPAFDCCPFVSVHGGFLNEAPTGTGEGGPLAPAHRVTLAAQLVYTVVITVVRCVPVPDDDMTPPNAEAEALAARTVNQDMWALWNGLSAALRAGILSERCAGAWREGATAITSTGGCGGWVLTYRVPIDGLHLTVAS